METAFARDCWNETPDAVVAITLKLVEFQRGSIAVEGPPGKGSTFIAVLPLADAYEIAS